MSTRSIPPATPIDLTDAPFVVRVGGQFLDSARTIGSLALLFAQIVARLRPSTFDRSEFGRTLNKMAVRSLPIVIVTALFTGAIMVVQSAPVVKRYGAEGLIGWGAGFGTLRELAPLLTALMISGRVGANNTPLSTAHGTVSANSAPGENANSN